MWLIVFTLIPIAVLVLFLLIRQITVPPLQYLADKISSLFRGEIERIERTTPLNALRPLIDAVNAAAVRIRDSDFSNSASFVQPLDSLPALGSQGQIGWLIDAIPDATLLLNGSGMILALNTTAKELLGIDEYDPLGIHFDEVVTSQNFKSFLSECLRELREGAKESEVRNLEYGDFSYQFSLYAWKTGDLNQSQTLVLIEKL